MEKILEQEIEYLKNENKELLRQVSFYQKRTEALEDMVDELRNDFQDYRQYSEYLFHKFYNAIEDLEKRPKFTAKVIGKTQK